MSRRSREVKLCLGCGSDDQPPFLAIYKYLAGTLRLKRGLTSTPHLQIMERSCQVLSGDHLQFKKGRAETINASGIN